MQIEERAAVTGTSAEAWAGIISSSAKDGRSEDPKYFSNPPQEKKKKRIKKRRAFPSPVLILELVFLIKRL